jgi:multimeric flavodoxin WrbA
VNAICLNCTLKRSPEASSAASLSDVVMSVLRDAGVEIDEIRLVDHRIDPGVVSEAVADGDEWPAIRERILAADILVIATPTWLGQPSSVSKRALERMDAFLSETREDGETRSPTTASRGSWSSATRTAPTTASRRSAAP